MTRGAPKKTISGVLLALLVVVLFLVRRVGGPGSGAPAFDPADYREAPVAAPAEASRHVGERARVCGTVAATRFVPSVGGEPTFLNLGRPYPDQEFDIVIWGRHRSNFPRPPEIRYRDARLCVSGRVTAYEGVPRIEVRTPDQIRMRSR